MACLARMDEKGRRPGRRQRGGNLAPDVAGFAHADHDNPPATFEYGLARLREGIIDAVLQAGNGLSFQLDDLFPFPDEIIFCHGLRGLFPSKMMKNFMIVADTAGTRFMRMDDYLMVGTVGLDVDAWQGGFYDHDLPVDWRVAHYSTLLRSVVLPEHELHKAMAENWAAEVDEDFRFVLHSRLAGAADLLDMPAGMAERVAGCIIEIPSLPVTDQDRDILVRLADRMPVCLDQPANVEASTELDILCRQLGASRVWYPSATEAPLASGRLLVALVDDAALPQLRGIISVLEEWLAGSRTAGLFHVTSEDAPRRARQTRLLAEMMGV